MDITISTKEYKVIKDYLIPNMYSRPQSKMLGIRGIGLHWVANPKSTAINNRNYFNNLRNQTTIPRRYASSHEIIGLTGEVVLCIPSKEVAFHAGAKSYKARAKQLLNNAPNRHLYGIEVCHHDWGGKFSNVTYKTVINRVVDLCIEFNLVPCEDTIWRHYDVTGKDCPKYYVVNSKEWYQLVKDIKKRYDEKVGVLVMVALEKWQRDMAEKAIDNLAGKGYVNNPQEHKKNLTGNGVPDWLYWVMLDRVEQGVK